MSATSPIPNIESAVQYLASTFAAAWNRHDPKALADLFVEDGDLINPAGRVANGRAEIEALIRDEHSTYFKDSRMNQTVDRVRVLTPDLVIATNRCEVTGTPMAHNVIATFVLRNERGTWRIVTARPMVPAQRPS